MTNTAYRLPDWLNGHEVEIVGDEFLAGVAFPEVIVQVKDHGAHERIRLAKRLLVEIKPPSIDDPVAWPLEIVNEHQWTVRLKPSQLEYGAATVELWTPEGNPARGVILSAAELRDLARAAWQRANAIEATS